MCIRDRALTDVLVAQHDSVLASLVHGAGRARLGTDRPRAVVAQSRQVEVVGVRPLARTLVLIPVHAPLGRAVTGVHGVQVNRVPLAAVEDLVVVEVPSTAELGASWLVSRDRPAFADAAAHLLPGSRRALTRLGVDGAPPFVLLAGLLGPEDLAGDRAGLAAHAFVEVEDHRNLSKRTGLGFHYVCHYFPPSTDLELCPLRTNC